MSTNYDVRTFAPSPIDSGLFSASSASTPARYIYLRPDATVTRATLAADGFWFPVPPPTYEFTPVGKWNQVAIVGLGDVIHPAGRGLAKLTFSSFFPSYYDPQVCVGIPGPGQFKFSDPGGQLGADKYVDILTNLHVSQDVVLLTMDTMIVNLPVAITAFSWSEQGGRPDHRLFNIEFTEWRKQLLTTEQGVRYQRLPNAYRPKSGEDLFDVSYRWYGTTGRAKDIAKLNGIKWNAKGKIPAAKANKPLKLPK